MKARSAALAATITLSLALMLALLAAAAAPLAAAEPQQQQQQPAAQAGAGPHAPTQAEMEAMMKLAAPGEQHKNLDRLAGKWKTTGKFWMAPGQPPSDMGSGTTEASWTLGGRFLASVHHGNFMGMAFEGHGLDGYDNVSKKYVGTWVDNMGTGLMTFEGSCDDPCKVLTTKSDFFDPMSNQKMTMRNVVTFVDANTYNQDMYVATPDGKEFKMMEIVAKRQ